MEETKQSKQPEPGRKADGKPKETKPLTPEEVRRRRKMLVYPLMLLVFGGAMWLIFAPSESGEPLQDGFNVEVPMPEEKGMPSDKRAAYELQAFERRQKEKMNTLQDLAVAESDGNDGADEDVFQTQEPAEAGQSSIRTSADAYRDINRQIGSFYTQPEPEDDQKTLELEWRIQELERQAEEDRRAKEAADEQLRLMEKSYEMASRYLPQNDVKSVPTTAGTDKPKAVPVTQVSEQVVSRLAQQHGLPHGNRPSAHGRQEQHPCLHLPHSNGQRRQGGGNPPARTGRGWSRQTPC